MNYKLAKKLKDAGFPQKEERIVCDSSIDMDDVANPTLEELIDACGGRFWNMTCLVKTGTWLAKANLVFPISIYPRAEGKTPTEAVANLWLKLNTK